MGAIGGRARSEFSAKGRGWTELCGEDRRCTGSTGRWPPSAALRNPVPAERVQNTASKTTLKSNTCRWADWINKVKLRMSRVSLVDTVLSYACGLKIGPPKYDDAVFTLGDQPLTQRIQFKEL